MNVIKTFHDDYGNIATIEKWETLPYRGAKEKTTLFRLNLMAAYDSNFLYHVSCYETLKDAIDKLRGFSCGTFLKDKQ